MEIVFLVVGQSQIEANRSIVREGVKRGAIFGDGFIEAAEVDKRGAEIGARVGEIGMGREQFAVIANGGGEIASLLRLDGGRKQLFDITVLRESR